MYNTRGLVLYTNVTCRNINFLLKKINDMIKNIMGECAHTAYIYHCRSYIFLTMSV